ncbi:hypothetical protein [Dyadobacter aurulentus]|uniref:hypothetical protein n=1 Tax=Dyadobacter sp. UC 10 TaxID=2605428 RepID=UPI0011F3F074|nr:hypothetical protein [Dyadobacter sp. UC 10]KAA0993409.1 hypothetical protein FXO21_26135 [Dyadobacter sp. UC 10]
METHLSWTGYFLSVGAAVAIYYVIIGIRYYRQDIRALHNSKSRFWERPEKPPPVSPPQATQLEETAEPVEIKKQPWQSESLFAKVEELSSQLRNSIREAYQKGYEKRDLIFLIQILIKDFSAVKGTPFREAINNVITSESAKYGFINLSAVELEELWKEV